MHHKRRKSWEENKDKGKGKELPNQENTNVKDNHKYSVYEVNSIFVLNKAIKGN